MDYVLFKENGLYDFRNVILPNIYWQLVETGDFEDAGLVCIGAVDNEQPAGALIMGLHEDAMASVYSIYVLPECRNRGIGTEMVNYAVSYALNSYNYMTDDVRLSMGIEYAMDEENAVKFRRFLTKNGFAVQRDLAEIFIVKAADAKTLNRADVKVCAVSDLGSAEEIDEVAAQFEEQGVNADPENCFVAGDPADPDYLFIAEYGEGNSFLITSRAMKETEDVNKYEALLAYAAEKMEQDYPGCEWMTEDLRNAHPEVWKKLADEKCVRAAAYLFADFTEEDEA